MVVRCLMSVAHVSEKCETRPLAIQIRITATPAANVKGEPTTREQCRRTGETCHG